MRVLIAVAFVFSAGTVQAQAYKCVVDGRTTYQDAPCANARSRAVDTSPSSEGVTGLKRDADRMAVKEARAQAEERNQAAREKAAKRQKQFDDMRNFNKDWARATLRSKSK